MKRKRQFTLLDWSGQAPTKRLHFHVDSCSSKLTTLIGAHHTEERMTVTQRRHCSRVLDWLQAFRRTQLVNDDGRVMDGPSG